MANVKQTVLNTIKKYAMLKNNDKIVVRSFRRPGLYLSFRYIKKIKRRKPTKYRNKCSTYQPYDKKKCYFRRRICKEILRKI